jgi:hypothetical protein
MNQKTKGKLSCGDWEWDGSLEEDWMGSLIVVWLMSSSRYLGIVSTAKSILNSDRIQENLRLHDFEVQPNQGLKLRAS